MGISPEAIEQEASLGDASLAHLRLRLQRLEEKVEGVLPSQKFTRGVSDGAEGMFKRRPVSSFARQKSDGAEETFGKSQSNPTGKVSGMSFLPGVPVTPFTRTARKSSGGVPTPASPSSNSIASPSTGDANVGRCIKHEEAYSPFPGRQQEQFPSLQGG